MANLNKTQWAGFILDSWAVEPNIRQFINLNYTPYLGDESFLQSISDKTKKVFNIYSEYCVMNGRLVRIEHVPLLCFVASEQFLRLLWNPNQKLVRQGTKEKG